MPLNCKKTFILLFLAIVAYGQQALTSVAVLPSDGTAINNDELEALTDEMRVAALKVLPTNAFTLLKQDVVIKRLGGMESYIKKCTESSCIVDLGKQAQVDYVSQASVIKLGNKIRLKVELYNVRTEGLVGMLNDEADNVKGLLSIVKKKAPEIFSKIKNYSVNITSEPEGADLSFDVVYSKCTTPCKIELPVSSVRITADLEEYETADTTISIKQNNQRILIKLNPNFGFLDVKPVYSDGIGKDEQWGLTLNGQSFYSLENKLPADKYKGELSHRCYEDISFNIGVGKGKRQVFDMAKQVKPKKGGLVLKSEKNGEPVFVNGKQVGKTPFSGSVPLCAVVEVGKSKEKVDVELEHNGRIEYTVEGDYDSRDYRTSNENMGQKKTFTDSRDGKKYEMVKIGKQTWMAENLNYNASGSKCYDNNPANCQIYGRLYNWTTAKKACPAGWHLPNNKEWNVLTTAVGGEEIAGEYLKATIGWNWNSYEGKSGNGTNAYGFSALPAGDGGSNGSFGSVGHNGFWWSSSEYDNGNAYLRSMHCCNYKYATYQTYVRSYEYYKSGFLSVRCLQN